jgi:ribosomal protein S27E
MPYVVCPACGIRTYSAARHSTADTCPKCDTKLARSPGVGARVREKPAGEIVPNARRAWVRVAP